MSDNTDVRIKPDAPGIQRAYSSFQTKDVSRADIDGKPYARIKGTATTPTPDRIGDIVEPKGAEFALPLPLLWQHVSHWPVGLITSAAVTDSGIDVVAELPLFTESEKLKARIAEAVESAELGLVRGLSIGFNPKEYSIMDNNWSLHFLEWEWLELSLVTIPANSEATLNNIKSFDAKKRAENVALDMHKELPLVRLDFESKARACVELERRSRLIKAGSVFK